MMDRPRCELCGAVLRGDGPLHRTCRAVIEADASGAVVRQMAAALHRLATAGLLSARLPIEWIADLTGRQRLALWRWLFVVDHRDPPLIVRPFLQDTHYDTR